MLETVDSDRKDLSSRLEDRCMLILELSKIVFVSQLPLVYLALSIKKSVHLWSVILNMIDKSKNLRHLVT